MATTFQYVARDTEGRVQRGVQAAPSAGEAVGALRQRGWSIIDVRPTAEAAPTLGEFWSRIRPSRWLPPRSMDIELSLNQMAVMLRGGLTLLTAMRTTAEQCRRDSMRRMLEDVAQRVQTGSTFADALARQRRFPNLVVQLVRVGEQTGTLEPVLRRGAEMLERRRTVRNSLLTALTYPTVVLIMALGVTAFMVISVIPKLEVFLKALGKRLPPMTQSLLDISAWLNRIGPQAAVISAALLVGLICCFLWAPGRLVIDRFLLRIPILGYLFRTAGTATFSHSLGLLIRSGVTLLEGLKTVQGLHRNRFLQQIIVSARNGVLQGGSLSEGLHAPHAFMPMLPAMVTVGESTGTLDDVLEETANFHDEQLKIAIRWFSLIIEPVIILVIGTIVGYVYIAFFMALFASAGTGG